MKASKWAWARLCLMGSLALALAACGGGGGEAAPPGEPLTNTSGTVGPAGGTLTLQGLSLVVPAGAVAVPVDVGVQHETVAAGWLARFRFSPAGQPLDAPAELRYSGPGLSEQARFFWEVAGEQWMIPGSVVDGVLRSQVDSLGYTATGTLRVMPAMARLAFERAQATADEGGSLVVQIAQCESHVPALAERLKRVTDSGNMALALAVRNDLDATRLACANAKWELLQQNSCEALRLAQANAQVLLADSFTEVQRHVVALLSAETFVQKTEADCPGNPSAQTMPLIQAKFEQFQEVLQSQLLRGRFAEEAGLRELQTLMSYEGFCQRMGLDSACDRLRDHIYPELLDGMREAAFNQCRAGEGAQPLSQFYAMGSMRGNEANFFEFGRFSLDDVEADLSYCKDPAIQIKVFDDAQNLPEEMPERATSLRPMTGMGSYQRRVSVAVPRNGSLTVSGQVPTLTCPNGLASNADLVVRLGTHEVARRSARDGRPYPIDTMPLDLVVRRMLAGTALDPEQTTDFTLYINREGGNCSDGDNPVMTAPFTMFQIDVNLGTPGACAPAVGQEFCFTLVEVPDDGVERVPKAINARGEVLLTHQIHCATDDPTEYQACHTVWKSGVSRALPARFEAVGIADDGTVAGNQGVGTARTDLNNHPAVVPPGATTSIRLATSVQRVGNGPDLHSDHKRVRTISPAGRVTYLSGDNGYNYYNQQLGFCDAQNDYCRRFVYYETTGPGWGPGREIRRDQLPTSGDTFDVSYDGDAAGRVGYLQPYASNELLAMKDFEGGAPNRINHMIDNFGTVLYTEDMVPGLAPASPHIPAGWRPYSLGRQGHALACGPADAVSGARQVRLVNLRTGAQTAPVEKTQLLPLGGSLVSVSFGCDRSDKIDPVGRVLVKASSSTNRTVRAAILTPRGEALP